MDSQKQTRIAKWALIVSIISLFAGVGISLFSLFKTIDASETLLEYQLEQERLPLIMALDYELPVEFATINSIGRNNIDFSSVPADLQPIKIPIYNVGIGFAQNCSIVWDKVSLNNACATLKDMLSEYYSVHEFELSKIASESGAQWATNDFIFVKCEDAYNSVRYYKYYSSPDSLLEYDYEIVEANLICKDVQFTYILPVLNQTDPIYIPVSDGLSILLLEVANLQISEPVSFCFDIYYQDLTGLNYAHKVEATFLLSNHSEKNNTFEVSFKSIEENICKQDMP